MAIISNEVIYILYRSIPRGIYSTDEREQRAAKNTPWSWGVELEMQRLADETDEALQARIDARIAQCNAKDNGTSEQPEYLFKVCRGTKYGWSETWQDREGDRFDSGKYQPVPWKNEPWAGFFHYIHFPHLSMKQPGKIAFTQSPEHGEADRQTIISPGKYLLRYFAEWVNQATVDAYCAQVDAAMKHLATPLQLAKTSDEIVHVYRNGPSSCMSKDRNSDDYSTGGVHPVSVYGAGDLAIAYFTDANAIKARAIVWPAKQIHGRIYGDEHRLKSLLQRDGYRVGGKEDWDGAKLLKVPVPDGDGYVCPYLDIGRQKVDVGKTHLIVACDGEYDASDISSVVAGDGCRNNDDEYEYSCDNCGTGLCEDDMCSGAGGDGTYCPSCYRAMFFYCEACETDCSQEDDGINEVITARGGILRICDSCASDLSHVCQYCETRYATGWSRRSTVNVDFYRSIDGDDEPGFCEACTQNTDRIEKRPCGHYAVKTDNRVCFCGAPKVVPMVCTLLRAHRVEVSR